MRVIHNALHYKLLTGKRLSCNVRTFIMNKNLDKIRVFFDLKKLRSHITFLEIILDLKRQVLHTDITSIKYHTRINFQ